MRVMVIGGTGTIGSAVVKALSPTHEVVTVGHQKGAYQVDLASPDSIARLFKTIGSPASGILASFRQTPCIRSQQRPCSAPSHDASRRTSS